MAQQSIIQSPVFSQSVQVKIVRPAGRVGQCEAGLHWPSDDTGERLMRRDVRKMSHFQRCHGVQCKCS